MKYGSLEDKTTLNGINAQSYSGIDTDITFARDVWSGKRKIVYADLGDDKGQYDSNTDTLMISRNLLGGDISTSAEWAAVASHENAHARGFLEERDAHMSELVTYLGVTGNLGIKRMKN